jgi:lipoprotein-anchoring transpeptidase ErfK/SrfK
MEGDAHVTTSSRIRPLAIALAVLIPIVPIVAAVVISSSKVPTRAAATAYIPSTLQASAQAPPKGSTADNVLPAGPGALVALVRHATKLRTAPGGSVIAPLPTHTPFGSPQALWVVRHTARWLGVISPLAGNGRVGWMPRNDASLGRVPWELRVSLSARKLTVLNDGKTVQRYTVAVGMPSAPTPTGRFAVTDRLNTDDPSGPYGCCILALSAVAPHAIQGWSGGNRIAIHSTPEPSSVGGAVSHGCVRLTLAEGRWLLAHIPLGTPTLISA